MAVSVLWLLTGVFVAFWIAYTHHESYIFQDQPIKPPLVEKAEAESGDEAMSGWSCGPSHQIWKQSVACFAAASRERKEGQKRCCLLQEPEENCFMLPFPSGETENREVQEKNGPLPSEAASSSLHLKGLSFIDGNAAERMRICQTSSLRCADVSRSFQGEQTHREEKYAHSYQSVGMIRSQLASLVLMTTPV